MKLVKMTGSNKKKLVIAIVGFIVVMLMLTILSRVVASFAVVEVETTTVSRNTVSKVIEASAVAQMRQEVAVRTEQEQTIETIYVTTGDTVKQGEALFKVRADDLSDNILKLEEDRRLAQLRIGSLYSQINEARNAAVVEQNASDQAQNPSNQTSAASSSIDELNYQLSSAIIERDRLDRGLGDLYALRDAGGVVHAPIGGTISEVMSRVGDVTTQGAVMLIADKSAGSKLVFSVSSKEAAQIHSDTIIRVTNKSANEDVEGIELAGIVQNSLSSTLSDITLHVPAESVPVGTMLDIKITISSVTHDSCLPLSALHQTSGGAYVFVVEEEQSALGTEQVARIAYVTVLAQDGRWAAVEGLGKEQLVIVKSAKMLTDKDRVLVSNG